ncbi:hypothetical protein CY35_10G088800 [Sphagnum magellanicum]|nr:hypothetical protein CY35_10G088800 [Sphagnum magellanicum]
MDVAEIGDVGEERGLLDLEMSCCACVGKRGNIRRSSAALEWDEAQQKVVAQRMQVGLSIHQLSLSAAQESSSCYNKRTGLVDTIVVPEELAELKDLTSILSLETWRTCLTEDERQDLCQYLPKAVDTEASVSTLLNGEHLFSKSPLPLWGAAVCDGSWHPDVLASRYLKNLHNGLTSSSGGMWGYYKKLEVTWKKRQGVENRSLVHAAREEIRTNASGPENGSQLQCVPEQSSRRQLIHAGSQEDYTKDKRYIEDTRKTLNKLRQGRKKQKINTYQEDVEQGNGPNSSAMSKWLENHSAMSFHHPVTGEELQDGVRIFKVSKRQFAVIMEKQDSGEDIHVYTLQSVLGNNSMGQASSNALQDHWQEQVLLELPLGHELFSTRKVQQAGRALLAAQLCVHQQAHVLLTPIHLSNGHVAADREDMVHREEKESLSTKLLDQRRLSCRQARTARDREQQWLKKPAPPPFAGVSRIEPEAFGPCELIRSYNEDPPMQNRDILHPPPAQVDTGGECHRASKSGKQSPPNEQVVQHNMRHESKDVSDEEESSIHQMWTSVSLDTQVLSSAEPLEPAGKDTDIHEMKLFADFWDPVKPVEGVAAAMGVVRGGLAREVESERETMIGAEEHTTASEMKLEGFSGNERQRI